ncbi:MAG TPA: HlyD family efflux transporter periplasmic adaptor subunit [Candidatus Flavonifractor merdipullorum]|uniref:HlyD family efflux transporter periplasmic adaptor subunit n=1 Tax=Candidatus Flavonifractor merdipullorum TaxID=2838590 RepID=A0A9D1RVC4_9FIRM|nr:HlyD family efflux transporter periplasmic adaptor subunit [Candidatus Flavonifractor merdipullorum]
MTEQQTPVAAPQGAPKATPPKGRKNRKKGKVIKTIITLVLLAAILGGGGFSIWYFLLRPAPVEQGEIYAVPAEIGSIQSTVSGSGNAKAKESAAITLSEGGTVRELFVAAGDVVTAGQPLYTIYSEAAEKAVTDAQEKVNALNKELAKLQEQTADLTVKAPFAGKLVNVQDFSIDQTVSSGTEVATLVNDKKLKLSLYFSYAYENSISVGQSVTVSLTSMMKDFTGTVEKINKVRYITPEGAVQFEVVISFNNPGTLTEGMDASAAIHLSDGTVAYPYASGKLEYYESRVVTTQASGPVRSFNLLNYADVKAGDVLLALGSDTIDDEIQAKQQEIAAAQETLNTAQQAMANFNAVAPIDGTVTACTLTEGAEVESGDTVIIISNSTTMLVNITVDDRNISFIKPGDVVNLDWNGTPYMGTVTSIDMGKAESGNGMTNFPVTLTVDNMDGSLIEGAWLQYSFVTSQSDNCVLIPGSAVKSVLDTEGNKRTVVFVKAETKPDDALELDLPEPEEGQKRSYPSEEDGYYPVEVVTGISDTQNVEIVSGIEAGEEVFVNYTVTEFSSGY